MRCLRVLAGSVPTSRLFRILVDATFPSVRESDYAYME